MQRVYDLYIPYFIFFVNKQLGEGILGSRQTKNKGAGGERGAGGGEGEKGGDIRRKEKDVERRGALEGLQNI